MSITHHDMDSSFRGPQAGMQRGQKAQVMWHTGPHSHPMGLHRLQHAMQHGRGQSPGLQRSQHSWQVWHLSIHCGLQSKHGSHFLQHGMSQHFVQHARGHGLGSQQHERQGHL
eukprot:TRINITY_DN2528_c0_g1_i1.p3 TRINITY_DN2528_c0_g1~~TRINITY_DN2528_c0_g1_i1.p3  ORF type:complete len:113 (+),score=20.07 TRINITY_DN2528_c0_g1_i1:146-484(+)